jgi:hypothetical protein
MVIGEVYALGAAPAAGSFAADEDRDQQRTRTGIRASVVYERPNVEESRAMPA